MNDLLSKIQSEFNEFTLNSQKGEEGNKSAARRARKATLNLEKLFKEYRKQSLETND